MKKLILLAPFVFSGLTACSSSAEKDDSQLSTGIMQPVSGTGASEGSYSWPSDVEPAPMPASMAK